jgi:(R)-2-hydroxyacyl-CoA dehydratese activating ATPase
MNYIIGIDIGTRTSKAVVIGDGGRVVGRHILNSGYDYSSIAMRLRDEVLRIADLDWRDISSIVTTGQGSKKVSFSNTRIADILCCAKGIASSCPRVRTVVDIQRTYTQVIRIDERGKIKNYAINEKCATGCGCFLEIMSNVLRIGEEELGYLAMNCENPLSFSTGCAVFGESEIISRVSEGFRKEDIIGGVHQAIANKILNLLNRVGMERECAVCGGGALNMGLIKCMEQSLGCELIIPSAPQFINALGAALMSEAA